jgi:hypothetical protein
MLQLFLREIYSPEAGLIESGRGNHGLSETLYSIMKEN